MSRQSPLTKPAPLNVTLSTSLLGRYQRRPIVADVIQEFCRTRTYTVVGKFLHLGQTAFVHCDDTNECRSLPKSIPRPTSMHERRAEDAICPAQNLKPMQTRATGYLCRDLYPSFKE